MTLPADFKCGRQDVHVEFKRFPVSFQQTLDNIIPTTKMIEEVGALAYRGAGSIKSVVLAETLVELRVNGVKITIDEDEPLKHLTDYGDDEFFDNIMDELMCRVVEKNGYLWRNKDCRRFFGDYAPEPEAHEEDPTKSSEPPTQTPETPEAPADTSIGSAESSSPNPSSLEPDPSSSNVSEIGSAASPASSTA